MFSGAVICIRYLETVFLCSSWIVVCDESGHTKFPFSYLAHLTLPHPGSASAQSLLRICSGQLTFAHPLYRFDKLRHSILNCFNSGQ